MAATLPTPVLSLHCRNSSRDSSALPGNLSNRVIFEGSLDGGGHGRREDDSNPVPAVEADMLPIYISELQVLDFCHRGGSISACRLTPALDLRLFRHDAEPNRSIKKSRKILTLGACSRPG